MRGYGAISGDKSAIRAADSCPSQISRGDASFLSLLDLATDERNDTRDVEARGATHGHALAPRDAPISRAATASALNFIRTRRASVDSSSTRRA